MPSPNEWLRTRFVSPGVGVDREAEVIRGYVVAQEGPFKTPGRGEFDRDGLAKVVELVNASPNGLKSRLAHPTLSSDGVGRFLGRAREARLDGVGPRESEGRLKTDRVAAVRADLHLDPSAHKTPKGDLAAYVMDLAQSDPDAFSSSLVLQTEKRYRLDEKGHRQRDAEGEDLPPLWYPQRLHASDVVDTGEAVDGFLSAVAPAEVPAEDLARVAAEFLDAHFAGLDRGALEEKAREWFARYLEYRFGPPRADPRIAGYRQRNRR